MSPPIRVVIADDHTLIRNGLKYLLSAEGDIQVVAETGNGREAVELVRQYHPTAVIMDISMPELNGLDATKEILAELPDTKILIISSHTEGYTLNNAFQSGALGYISKVSSLLDVPQAIREILGGRLFIRLSPTESVRT